MLTPTPMVCKEMRYGGDAKSSIQRVMLMDAQLLILIRKLSESKGCKLDALRSFEAATM
jgi:hypothetical protein